MLGRGDRAIYLSQSSQAATLRNWRSRALKGDESAMGERV